MRFISIPINLHSDYSDYIEAAILYEEELNEVGKSSKKAQGWKALELTPWTSVKPWKAWLQEDKLGSGSMEWRS